MAQTIDLALLNFDFQSNGRVNCVTSRAYLALVVAHPTLATGHSMVLTDFTPGTTPYCETRSKTPVRAIFPLTGAKEGVPAALRRLWLT